VSSPIGKVRERMLRALRDEPREAPEEPAAELEEPVGDAVFRDPCEEGARLAAASGLTPNAHER
jgi:hypothetical protein